MASDQWKQAVVQHVDQSSRVLFLTANRILQNAMEAEDICQQAYVKALGAESQVRDAAALHAWLTRIVINRSLDVLRRRQVERRSRRHTARPDGRIDKAMHRLEDRDYVIHLLAKLDERTRQVVVMRLIQGLSGRQVTERMGCSAALVSRLLHDGLAQMRMVARDDAQQELYR